MIGPLQGVFLVLLIFQGILISWDELYYHRKRVLSLWEKWGHPLDTLVFTLALGSLWLYGVSLISIGLGVFSCLFVLKDEWVHLKHCGVGEQMLHGLLFMLHGGLLLTAHGMVWFDLYPNGVSILPAESEPSFSISFTTELVLLAAIGASCFFVVVQLSGQFFRTPHFQVQEKFLWK